VPGSIRQISTARRSAAVQKIRPLGLPVAAPATRSAACETEALADVVMTEVFGPQLADLARENGVPDPGSKFDQAVRQRRSLSRAAPP
jgi:hypothetical protein